MKKLFSVVLVVVALALCSCGIGGIGGGSSNLPTTNVDYQMLSNDAELGKVYGVVVEKLGDNIKYVDKIRLSIYRPSKEGSIIREGAPDEFYLTITHLYQQDKKKLYEMEYSSTLKWETSGARSVEVYGSVDVEKFRLEDEMFDMSPLTAEILSKIVKDALAKYKDETKYSDQYVDDIIIERGIVKVSIKGKLSANDLEQTNYYKADLKGMAVK